MRPLAKSPTLALLVGLLMLALHLPTVGCSGTRGSDNNQTVLRLATTTSTKDSGLLDVLLPAFENRHQCRVDVLAVGTGAALKHGEMGEADAVLVHAPRAEEAFLQAGHGLRRETFMSNHFVILGPAADPAGVQRSDPSTAFRKIAASRAPFVSRGDDSGTHKREIELWQQAGGLDKWQAYQETGEGMGHTLVVADQLQGYVLADQGTFLRFHDKIELVSLVPPSDKLMNLYSVITVNPAKHEKINGKLASALVDFLISPDAQRMINEYRVSGQTLFRGTR